MNNNHTLFIKKVKKEKRSILFWQIFIIISFIFIWEILSYFKIINPFIYSSPSKIIKCIINLLLTNNLFNHIFTTLYEIILSFFIGISLAFLIATIFYNHPKIAKIFDPFITIINSLPKVALGPMIIITAGANIKSIIIMAILINFIVSLITIYNGFSNIDTTKIKLFKVFNASKKDILFKLVIPASYNSIISSLKLNISLTLIGVITGEFLSCKEGIGYLIIYGTQIFDLTLVLSGITILLIFSFILYKFVSRIEKTVY